MHEDRCQAFGHRRTGAGQEAGAHPPRLGAQTQIETGGLHLARHQRLGGNDFAAIGNQPLQHMAG